MSIVARLAGEKGLQIVKPAALTVRRVRRGKGFGFVLASGAPLRDPREIARLKALAVPPAYTEVRFAADPGFHLQAVGKDAAGRLQYRYHPRWTEVREALKARRLAGLAASLPTIRRAVARRLAGPDLDRTTVVAAVVELVSLTAIRAGGESYAREHGTRGAATLLKSNVRVSGRDRVTLSFRAKGGKRIVKEVRSRRLCAAVTRLSALPGPRLFQWHDGETCHAVRAAEVNAYLKEVSGKRISLKDFRTLVASARALEALSATEPAASERQRRRQVRETVVGIAEELANTPTVCRTSYVHEAVVTAFESGALKRPALRKGRSVVARAAALARIVARHGGERS